jgi:predicted phosphoribosyltransferase
MAIRFRNRFDAGQALAKQLSITPMIPMRSSGFASGGVPSATKWLGAEDSPRRVCCPETWASWPPGCHWGHRERRRASVELEAVNALNIPEEEIEATARKERSELNRREAAFEVRVLLRSRAKRDFGGRRTGPGSTMRAAVVALRQKHPRSISVAVPVAAPIVARNSGRRLMK